MKSKTIIVISITTMALISLIFSLIGIYKPLLILDENQILYLFSTSAQVLAGIYGLTLTGFIFFRNELSREEFEDDTLSMVIDNLKRRYFEILIFITIITILTLIMSNLVISIEQQDTSYLNTVLMNVGQVLFIVNLVVIAYFIFDVTKPGRKEEESKRIQQSFDPIFNDDEKGNLEEFLSNYNTIESIIQKYGQAFQSEIEGEPKYRVRRFPNSRLAQFIFQAEKIDFNLLARIENLIKLRNSIVHSPVPEVSKHMVTESETILNKLKDALRVA